jgi:hypothetical protein
MFPPPLQRNVVKGIWYPSYQLAKVEMTIKAILLNQKKSYNHVMHYENILCDIKLDIWFDKVKLALTMHNLKTNLQQFNNVINSY